MNVLVVSQYFWPESFRINELAATLAERGVATTVLTGKPNYPEGSIFPGYQALGCIQESYLGVNVLRVPLFPRGKKSKLRLALNYLSFIVSASVFGSLLLRGTLPHVILVYCPSPLLQALPALLIGWLKRVPVVIYVQDLWPESLEATGYVRNSWILSMVRWVVKYIYRHADLILVSSRPFAKSISNYVPDSRIVYYPNSVDASFRNPDTGLKLEMPTLDSGFSVVFAGNVGSAQAVNVIVDAAALLTPHQEIRLVVLGAGSELEWMKRQVQERHLENLHLMGRFPVEAMPWLLSKASALLVTLADQTIFESTVPNKIQAYLAVGRPIVACLNGEGARIVEEAGAGLTVRAENASDLADAIFRLYRLPTDERKRLGASGQAYYQKYFDHESLVTDLIGHLQEVIGGRP
jgi:glycosyltransferase involved in cell wall biosynthesis